MLTVEIPTGRNLSKPLGRVTSAAGNRSPIEGCVLLEANDNGLTLTTLDSLTHQLCLNVPEANVIDHGQLLINAATFKDLAAKLETGAMNLAHDVDNKKLRVCAESDLELEVHGEPVENFRREAALPPVVGVVDAHQFASAIDRAVALLQEGEFVTLVAVNDQLLIYTSSKNCLYSRAAIELRESAGDFAIAIPMSLWTHMPPKPVGLAELRLHPDFDFFAVAIGNEYLLVKQVVNDLSSLEVEHWVGQASADYWVLASDKLLRDLQRASSFKDNAGLRLEVSKNRKFLNASCKSASVGKMKTPHELVDEGGDTLDVSVDPKDFEGAVRALGAANVVIEQLKETIEGMSRINVWLRLKDADNVDARVVVISTLV